MGDRLLLKEEPSASELIASRLREEGIDIRVGKGAGQVRPAGAEHELLLEGSEEGVAFDTIIVAAGRAPRTDGLGLETVGVELGDSGAISVDRQLRTTGRGIFAVGDVTGLLPSPTSPRTTPASPRPMRCSEPEAESPRRCRG